MFSIIDKQIDYILVHLFTSFISSLWIKPAFAYSNNWFKSMKSNYILSMKIEHQFKTSVEIWEICAHNLMLVISSKELDLNMKVGYTYYFFLANFYLNYHCCTNIIYYLAINSLLQEFLVIEDSKGYQRYTISDRL